MRIKEGTLAKLVHLKAVEQIQSTQGREGGSYWPHFTKLPLQLKFAPKKAIAPLRRAFCHCPSSSPTCLRFPNKDRWCWSGMIWWHLSIESTLWRPLAWPRVYLGPSLDPVWISTTNMYSLVNMDHLGRWEDPTLSLSECRFRVTTKTLRWPRWALLWEEIWAVATHIYNSPQPIPMVHRYRLRTYLGLGLPMINALGSGWKSWRLHFQEQPSEIRKQKLSVGSWYHDAEFKNFAPPNPRV